MPKSSNKYAPTKWQSGRFELECPSGQLCLVRKLQMEDIVQLGLIDELDTFTSFASNLGEDDKNDADTAKAMTEDPEAFKKIISIVDRVVCATVVEPTIIPSHKVNKKGVATLIPEDDREGDAIYSDYVDFEDKMHIFSTVFSGDTINQFRRGTE